VGSGVVDGQERGAPHSGWDQSVENASVLRSMGPFGSGAIAGCPASEEPVR
jgi:hypothetical protein